MRFLGKKSGLLGQIDGLLCERGLEAPGVLFDPFTGSAAVARHMRQRGWKVIAGDLLQCSVTQAQAAVALERPPCFRGALERSEVQDFLRSTAGQAALNATAVPGDALRAGSPHEYGPLRAVLAFLNEGSAPVEGFVSRQYAPGGVAGRCYFTDENARRIDGVRGVLDAWSRASALEEHEAALLLAALLDGVDRVASISGTYGAFLKRWTANARQRFTLTSPFVPPGPAGIALRGDANALARRIECDVAYLDPPYNGRQFPKFFHVLEILALLGSGAREAAVEADLAGTTGLPQRLLDDRLSRYCMKRARGGVGGKPAAEALRDLLANLRARHVVMSYTEEGVLDRDAVVRAFEDAFPGFDPARDMREVERKRFRSDADRRGREYRVVPGRGRNVVAEWLIHARRPEPVVVLDDGQLAFAWAADA